MIIRRRRIRTRRTDEEAKKLRKKIWLLPAGLAAVAVLSAAMYLAVDNRDVFSMDQFSERVGRNTVEINGVRCRRRTRIKSYLFMGVDCRGKVGEHFEEDGGGQSDVLMLVVIDQNRNTYTTLAINRDTITEVNSLEDDGTFIAATDVQIALAHAKGDGREISCENAVTAVSHLLLDQPIDGYLALNMDSIGVINHELGGVTVTIEDDFSQSDPSLRIGETVKLSDEQAMSYVRGRMTVGDGSNTGRMRRQDQYLESAGEIFRAKLEENARFANQLYDALGDYMVTSLSGKDVSKLAKAILSNEELESPVIEGENSLDRLGHNQFTVDQESLEQAVLELFYEEV